MVNQNSTNSSQNFNSDLKEFVDSKNVVSIITERNHLQNIREQTKPYLQKIRVFVFVFFIIATAIAVGVGVKYGRINTSGSSPGGIAAEVGAAVDNQLSQWSRANSNDCLAIDFNPQKNLFLKSTAHVNTYNHGIDNSRYTDAGSIVNADRYNAPLQLFDLKAIVSVQHVNNTNANKLGSSRNVVLQLRGGNVLGSSLWQLNIAGSLSFGSQLPWDVSSHNTDMDNLRSKELEATMSFTFDVTKNKTSSAISGIKLVSLTPKYVNEWKQHDDLTKKTNTGKEKNCAFVPLLNNAESQSTGELSNMSDVYNTSYKPFSYTSNNNRWADSFFQQPPSHSPGAKGHLFKFLYPNNRTTPVGFSGVRTPFIFSRRFVEGEDTKQMDARAAFFSNLMFSNLKLSQFNKKVPNPSPWDPSTVPLYGTYKSGVNPLYKVNGANDGGKDSWSMIGVSKYYGTKNSEGVNYFSPATQNPINSAKNGNNLSAKDSYSMNNLLGDFEDQSSQKLKSIAGDQIYYPGFSHNSLPFYNFAQTHLKNGVGDNPYLQNNFGLYHSADLGDAVNQMSAESKSGTNTSVADITNALGMANISFGGSNNPYKLDSSYSNKVNLFDSILNSKSFQDKQAHEKNGYTSYNLETPNTNSSQYKNGMPALTPNSSVKINDVFFDGYFKSTQGSILKDYINNYLLALEPRLILKSYFTFIPYGVDMSDTNQNFSGSLANYDDDATRWALAIIMPRETNLVVKNSLMNLLYKDPRLPAFKIHNSQLDIGGDYLDRNDDSMSNYQNISFQLNNSDKLPLPTNWWVSMDDRSAFANHQLQSDPTLSIEAAVGAYNANAANYPNLSFAYASNEGVPTTMSAHPGAFSWFPFAPHE